VPRPVVQRFAAFALVVAGCAGNAEPARSATAGLAPERVSEVAHRAPASAPASVSLGRPNGGALQMGVRMPDGPAWHLTAPHHAWGTGETVAQLTHAIEQVHARFPDGHPLYIGDLSRELGGPLYPHLSHQSGRDVDLGYYYQPRVKAPWYLTATPNTLDRARTWALIKTLITETDVEFIFVDRRVQTLLREHALARGEDREWLDTVLKPGSRYAQTLVRHAAGHATHMHVRFYSSTAPRPSVAASRLIAVCSPDTSLARSISSSTLPRRVTTS
jgi:penicillin-insensitive murein endopeptidase